MFEAARGYGSHLPLGGYNGAEVGEVPGSQFTRNNPAPGFEYLEVNIPRLSDFGTGTYKTVVQANALDVPFPITCAATSRPVFQILLSIFPDTREILVLLGRVDNTPPISKKVFGLPHSLDPSKSHTLQVVFRNWKVETLTLDRRTLRERFQGVAFDSGAERYLTELGEIANRLQSMPQQGAQGPLLEPVFPALGPPIPFLQAQKTILENLFSEDWFRKPSTKKLAHPAYRRWKLCGDLLSRGGALQLPEDNDRLPELAKMLADNQFIVVCTKGRLDRFSIGSLANYGDPEVQKRIRSVIFDPSQFLDVLTELGFAASHLTREHKVTAHEKLGFPDFEVAVPGWDLPFAVDCKRLKRDTSEQRIGSAIKKANEQVKALGKPCYGLAVLDVSEKVNILPELSDEIPQEVVGLKRAARKATSLYNTSISAVLLLWDDFVIVRVPRTGGDFFSICLRRRYELVLHTNPKHPLNGDIDTLSVGNTLIVGLKATPRILLPDSMVWGPI